MAYRIKLKIQPSINRNLKIYVYRSKNQSDIESIGKVKNLLPVIILDENTYPLEMMENDQYVIYDAPENPSTVVYNGPQPTAIPTNEYETIYSVKSLNEYTGYSIVKMNPLPLDYAGTLYYYSIIGVDTANTLITHISRVKAEILHSDYVNLGTREIQYCNDYNGLPTDIWETLTMVDWNTNIVLGDLVDTVSYTRFGSPFIDEIKIFDSKIDDMVPGYQVNSGLGRVLKLKED